MKIRIKSYKELQELKDVTKEYKGIRHRNSLSFFNDEIKHICGKEIEVSELKDSENYSYTHVNLYGVWFISDWMIKNNMNRNGANL